MPGWIYEKLRHKYQLVIRKDEMVTDDYTGEDKLPDEVVFEADTNLPIRMLFILNAIPLLNAKETSLEELEYASGTSDSLAKKIFELNGGKIEKKEDKVLEKTEKKKEDNELEKTEEKMLGVDTDN